MTLTDSDFVANIKLPLCRLLFIRAIVAAIKTSPENRVSSVVGSANLQHTQITKNDGIYIYRINCFIIYYIVLIESR